MKITKLFAALLAVLLLFSVLTLCVLADEAESLPMPQSSAVPTDPRRLQWQQRTGWVGIWDIWASVWPVSSP